MNNKSFVRKIIYISIIAALLIPMSLVSRPATKGEGAEVEGGGQLAQLRKYYRLSQAQLMEIDPASETMKLASLGLRGVAVNLLWMQAIEHKKKENYDQLAATLRALIKIQPNFVKVWEYQAHNMSYNISMEFDDYEYRYHWVKKGIGFLRDGVPYNRRDHRMTDNLGFFTGMKIGRSDERDQFRRMFRVDDEFHNDMASYIEPDTYDSGEYGRDNWKMAYQWYDISRQMVDERGERQYMGDMLFYSKRPAQLRNQARSLQREYKTDEVIQEIWQSAHNEWMTYGKRPITNSLGVQVTMEGMLGYEIRLDKLRAELDAMAPGVRQELLVDLKKRVNITEEEERAMAIPADQRTDEEVITARRANVRLLFADSMIDVRVLEKIPPEKGMVAKRLMDEIVNLLSQMRTIDNHNNTNNYRFWRTRNAAEASELGVRFRKALYEAEEMRRRSIFDDNYEVDYKTKEKINIRKGAISLYEDAFNEYRLLLDEYPRMLNGEMAEDVLTALKEYQEMLRVTGRLWPRDFPLQRFIDERAAQGEEDQVPTSEDVEDLYSTMGDSDETEDEDSGTGEDDPQSGETATENSGDENPGKTESSGDDKSDDDKADDDKSDDDKLRVSAGT